jgi:hypothetical protein
MMKTTAILIVGCVLGAIAGLSAAASASAQYYVSVYAPPVAVNVYVPARPAYPYAYVYNPRRAYRLAVRYGYVPVPVVVTRGPTDFYGRYLTGYSSPTPVYGGYPSPTIQSPAPQPTPAPQPASAAPPAPQPAGEAIPAPPAELGR